MAFHVSINVFINRKQLCLRPARGVSFNFRFPAPFVKAGRVDRGGVDRPLQLPLGLAKCMVAVLLANRRFSGQGQGAVGSDTAAVPQCAPAEYGARAFAMSTGGRWNTHAAPTPCQCATATRGPPGRAPNR